MNDDQPIDPDLVAWLASTANLSPAAARRCIGEVLAFYSETLERFVRRRHRALQAQGVLRNADIYRQIASEVAARPFAAPPLSERQILRLIYG